MVYDKFLCNHVSVCLCLCVYVSILIVFTQLLLLVATQFLIRSLVGIKVYGELSYFSRVVKICLMFGRILVAMDSAVVQMVVGIAVCQQVVGIITTGFHVVVDMLIKAAKGVLVIDLIAETHTSL